MLLAIILAASSFPVGAAITHDLPPEVIMFIRFFLAGALFAPFVLIKHGMAPPTIRSLLNYNILSIPLVIFFWCMFESLRYTSTLNTGALYTIVPAITALFALLINGEITGKIRSFGLILGTFGALWIVFRGNLNAFLGLEVNYGDFIFFLGCLFLGLYNPLVKRLHQKEPMEVLTFWVLISGSIWLFVASLSQGITQINWYNIEQNVYLGVAYLALFSTLITFFIINLCTIKIGATKVAAYGFLTPVFVIIMSLMFGLEPFEMATMPGLLLIIGAMFLIQRDGTNAKDNNS